MNVDDRAGRADGVEVAQARLADLGRDAGRARQDPAVDRCGRSATGGADPRPGVQPARRAYVTKNA